MARPPLPVGTYGKIKRTQAGPNSWRARTSFRDYDGITRDVEAYGRTATAAENALKKKLRDRAVPSTSEISAETTIVQLSELWLEEVIGEERISKQSIDRYRDVIRRVVVPALGGLRIREAKVTRLDRALKAVAKEHPAEARTARVVLGQMLGLAVRHGALTTNPVREVGRLRKNTRHVKALAVEDLHEVRSAIRKWQTPEEKRPGPARSKDLADIIDALLATGARIGEVLAFRWSDLDIAGTSPEVTISGTLVYLRGTGLIRQEWTKSDAGYRTVSLPKFAVDVLKRRQAEAKPNDLDAVFPSRKGTWLAPNNVRRQWREARKDTGLEWVIPHTFRKTVATLIDKEADTDTAAAQLGHENGEITKTYYIQKARKAPDVSGVLDALGPDPAIGA